MVLVLCKTRNVCVRTLDRAVPRRCVAGRPAGASDSRVRTPQHGRRVVYYSERSYMEQKSGTLRMVAL